MNDLPYELIEPEVAAFMQRVFAAGLRLIEWPWGFEVRPPRAKRSHQGKYRKTIKRIRRMEDCAL